jgi:hypothetical protein
MDVDDSLEHPVIASQKIATTRIVKLLRHERWNSQTEFYKRVVRNLAMFSVGCQSVSKIALVKVGAPH